MIMMGEVPKKNWRNSLLAVLVVGVAVLACDQTAPDMESYQTRHCEAAITWMNKGEGTIEIVKSQSWMYRNERNVSVVYDLTTANPKDYMGAKALRLIFLCRYPANPPATGRAGKGDVSAGRAIYMEMNGRKLSKVQVNRLNTVIGLMGGSSAARPKK